MFDALDINRRIPGHFRYFRCSQCRLVFIDDIPDDLGRYYAGGYQTVPAFAQEIYPLAKKESYRLDSILKYRQSGKLLEIGPWIGLFSCAAKNAGFAVTAIEMNEQCVEFLRDQLHIRAIQSTDPASTLDSMDETFDVIALWHSIEHLPRPWEVIAKAAKRLSPGGILVVAAPNPDSAQFAVLGERWYHLDAPRHLYLLPHTLVSDIGNKHGLETVSFTTNDKLGNILSRIGWHHFVGRFVPIPGLRRVAKTIVSPLLAKLSRDDKEGAGAGYTTIMRRPT